MHGTNLEEAAFDEILMLILAHHFKPGDFLLETELAERLGMRSRTPVRHALTRLVAMGFLEKRKKRGYVIPYPSREDAAHVFFARAQIEGINAAAACRNCSEQDVDRLRGMLDNEEKTCRSGHKQAYSCINADFHAEIARLAGNPYLERYTRHLFWRSSYYVFYFGSYYSEKEYVQHMLAPNQHRDILAAIAAADEELAQQLMQRHISSVAELIVSKIVF